MVEAEIVIRHSTSEDIPAIKAIYGAKVAFLMLV